jgi:hypothetical protein
MTLLGFLAGYRIFTRDAYGLDRRQFTARSAFWARTVADLRLSAPRSAVETLRAQFDLTSTRRYVLAPWG